MSSNRIKLLLTTTVAYLFIGAGAWAQCSTWIEGDYTVCTNSVTTLAITGYYDNGEIEVCSVASVEGSANWVDAQGWLHWGNVPGIYRVYFSCPGGCTNIEEYSVEVKEAEIDYPITGGGTVCNGSQATIMLAGSQIGLDYGLLKDGAYTQISYSGNLGGPISWTVSGPGTYRVYANEGCSYWGVDGQAFEDFVLSGSATVTYAAPPQMLSVQGGGNICAGATASITMPSSQSGISYELRRNDGQVVSTLVGNGGQITWTGISAPPGSWTYQVTANNAGCARTMNGTPALTVQPVLQEFNVSGGGAYCTEGTGVSIILNGSQTGVNYQLKLNGINSGTPIGGHGGSLAWPDQTSGGVYTITANNASGCSRSMGGSATVIEIPSLFTVEGGGSYCPEGGSVPVTLNGSQAGVSYQLAINGQNAGAPLTGTGGSLQWPGQTIVGNYGVFATNSANCTRQMTSSVNVSVSPQPISYVVQGGGTACIDASPFDVTLNGSESGVSYQLKIGNTNSGPPLAGTGNALTWAGRTTSGTYTVTATKNLCSRDMSSSAIISVVATPVISGPSQLRNSPVVLATGTITDYSYQWKRDGDNVDINGQSASLTASQTGSYQVQVSAGGCVVLSGSHYLSQEVKRQYNGTISAVRWRTDKPFDLANAADYTGMYVYSYDDKYQIKEASWATPNFTLNSFTSGDNTFRVSDLTYDPNGNIKSMRRYNKLGVRTNDFAYHYQANKNKLTDVTGHVNAYTYNLVGQLIGEDKVSGDDQYIEYEVSGKVRKVFSDAAKQNPKVEYIYDDRGFRLAKKNLVTNKTTWYIRDASGNVLSIHEEDNAGAVTDTEVPIYGAGKLGTYYPQQEGSVGYELTDHLGNVRAIVRDNIATYTATMEDNGNVSNTNPRVAEMQHFQNLFKTEKADIHMNHTSPVAGKEENPEMSAYLFWQDGVQDMDAEDKSIGPGIMLRVNGGDKVAMETWVRYENKTSYNRDVDLLLMAQLLGTSFASTGTFEGTIQATNTFETALGVAGYANDGTDDTRPYAYLNYILFNDNMTLADAGWKRVPLEAGFNAGQEALPGMHQRVAFDEAIEVSGTGYIYVWVSNESANTKVWFDDLKVAHTGSFVVQAMDYGVWGDVLREQKTDETKYRFGYQGQFAEKDEETGWNHFELREYDPVIGRWTSRDPQRQFYSPYIGMGNNPGNGTDPDGGKFFSDFVNAKTGERVHIDDGIDVVVIVENENWRSFMDFYKMTSGMSIPTQRFGLLSQFGDNYQVGRMIDFYNTHDANNFEHHEWNTNLFKEGNQVFPNPDPLSAVEGTSGHTLAPTSFDPRESANLHTHNWPGAYKGPSKDWDLEKHWGVNGVYNVVIDGKHVHFYNRGENYINEWGRPKYRSTGMNFSIPRSLFK